MKSFLRPRARASRLPLLLALQLGAVGAAVVTPAAVHAQPANVDEEAGRQLATEAMGHYNESEFAKALESFDKAREVYPAAQVLRMRGYTLMAMERWLAAADALDEALKSDFKPLVPADAEHAEDQLEKVLTHLSVITVESSVSGATVKVDGGDPRPLPATIRLEPGAHTFLVEADGYEPVEESHELKVGEKTLSLDPVKAGGAPPPPKPLVEPEEPDEPDEPTDLFGWFPGQGPVGLTTAAVGIVTGGIGLASGLYGMSLRSSVQDNIAAHNQSFEPGCATQSDLCRANAQLINRDGARAADWENTGIAMGIVGGSLFVVGTTLWLFSEDSPLAPDEPSEPADAAFDMSCGGSVTGQGAAFGCQGTF